MVVWNDVATWGFYVLAASMALIFEVRRRDQQLADAHSAAGDDWEHAVEESELLSADGSDYDREQFLSGAATPVLFTSAALNFGVNQLLDVLVELAPPPKRGKGVMVKDVAELVDDAKNQADKIVGEARTKAERLEAEGYDAFTPEEVEV